VLNVKSTFNLTCFFYLFFLLIISRTNLERKLQDDIETRRSTVTGMDLLRRIWTEVRKLKIKEILDLTTKPSAVLFDAIESGNHDIVIEYFMESVAILTNIKDSNGRNLVHLLFLYRRLEVFHPLVNDKKQHLLRAVDNEGNNVLHLAALLPLEFKSFSGLSAKIQMQRELGWFEVSSFISFFLFNRSLLISIVRHGIKKS